MTSNPLPIPDDEIDLRAVFQTLWKARAVVIIVAIAAAVAAFAVSYWVLPLKYQSTAYVSIGTPIIPTRIEISPKIPDLQTVVNLATGPGLLEGVTNDPQAVNAIGRDGIVFATMASVVSVGTDQISLSVTDTNAQRAALLANIWAEKVTESVNASYGYSIVMKTLDSQVLQAQQSLEMSQSALEEALSKNRSDALDAKLEREQADFGCILEKKSQILRALDDLQIFEQGLNKLSGETPLFVGDGVILMTLQQASLTSQPCQLRSQPQSVAISEPGNSAFTFQVDRTAFSGLTISKTLSVTVNLRTTLQSQTANLEKEQSRLEQEIPQLKKELESSQSQLKYASLKKDQSQALYDSLLDMQQKILTVVKQSAEVATVRIQATPSQNAISRKVLMNTILAGIVGLMFAMFWVLAVSWWRNNEYMEENKQGV